MIEVEIFNLSPHKPFKCGIMIVLHLLIFSYGIPKKRPILCQRSLCIKSVDECKVREKDTCPDYRCFDGTCVKSMELCPTYAYYDKGIKKCLNSDCVEDINECKSPILEECSYRCPDLI